MLALTVFGALIAAATARPSDYQNSRCQYNGQFLPNDYDVCTYFRCDYGSEPWYDAYGKIKFVEVKMKCPYGTSTNKYHFDPYNPCGEVSYKCSAPPAPKYYPQPSYHSPPQTSYYPQPVHHQPSYPSLAHHQPHQPSYTHVQPSYSHPQPHPQPSYPHPPPYQPPQSYPPHQTSYHHISYH